MDSHFLRNSREDVPCWYDLRLNDTGLIMTIPYSTWDEIEPQLEVPTVRRGQEVMLDPYQAPDRITWGFGLCTSLEIHHTEVIITWPLPKYSRRQRGARDWRMMWNITATIQAMLNPLMMVTAPSPWTDRLQLMTLTGLGLSTEQNIGGAIDVSLSPRLVRWIRAERPTMHHPAIESRMIQVYENLIRRRLEADDIRAGFRAHLAETGSCILQVPGNACGLSPDRPQLNGDGGYQLSSNNADSPIQQLSLLAGLAALNMAARQTADAS